MSMLGGLFEILGNLSKWLTPKEKAKRSRMKLQELKDEKQKILQAVVSEKSQKRYLQILREIRALENYLASREGE